ncbi:hypothetical protein IV203_027556 [Nitzschia inconspicua]|uniref:Peroxin-13 n=1 Tax=Nitzschia inconspicua TaxID=303405 RepID=A0A9K3LXX5_9STRA|nr:hypothetical protein IV203_027556 [Nitzschia inconspicua]
MPPRSAQLHAESSVERRDKTLGSNRTSLTTSKTIRLLQGTAATVNDYKNSHGTSSGQRRVLSAGSDRRRTAKGIKRRQTKNNPSPTTSNGRLNDQYDYRAPEAGTEGHQLEQETTAENDQVVGVADPNATNSLNPYNINTIVPYGTSLYGSSAAAGTGMMMMPPMYMGGMGPFSGAYQVLYGVQNVVFSISQAVQLVGMNQQLLQQAWESLSQMVDHAISAFHEMRALEQKLNREETEEDKQRRKRLKALRYALVFGGSWLAYKIVRGLLFHKKNKRRLTTLSTTTGIDGMGSYVGSSAMSPYSSSSSHYGHGIGYGNPYSTMNNSTFFGGMGCPGSNYL